MTHRSPQPPALALLFAAFAALAPATAANYQDTVLSLNPAGYWRLNETASSPPVNTLANSSPLGPVADGNVVLDVGKGEPGVVGNAIRLQNPGNVVAYAGSRVDIPFNAALNPSAPFTVEFWSKPNALGTDGTGFSPLSSFDPNFYGGANRSGWLFYLNNTGRWQFRLGLTSGYAVTLNAAGISAAPGEWQHIVATYDGSTARIFVNGVERGSAPVAAGWLPNTQAPLRIGATPLHGSLGDGPTISSTGSAGNRGYDGWVDELAIYPSLLSAATIAAHYDAATTNNAGYATQILADQPSGYWRLDDPAASTPDPASLPTVTNAGSAGPSANGVVHWGASTAQPGSGYAGLDATNHAVQFNGSGGYIELGESAGLRITGSITLLAWVKPTVKDFFRNILAWGWADTYAETFLRISRGAGDVFPNSGAGDGNYYEVGVTDGTPTFYDAARIPIPPGDIGNWVLLAGTYDGANWNLYRNGQLVSSVPSPNGALAVTNRWAIGSRSDPTEAEGLYFGGSIDEPAIFATSLSATDIAALYEAAQVPPVITEAPQGPGGTIFKGSSVSFSVWAEGSAPLHYSWSSNGVPLGVTTTNLTVPDLGAGTNTFAVTVENPYGSVTREVTVVAVAAPPAITQSPVSQTRFAGFPFSFSVVTSGSTPLDYQWNHAGSPIPGATNTTYSELASAERAGLYTVTISNEAGTIESDPVNLTVPTPPTGYASAVVGSSPVGFWRLGESSGTIASDHAGGHDGHYVGATLGVPGVSAFDPDQAASFSGANSYVGGISGTAIDFSGHTNFTVELWAKAPAGLADESTLVAKGTGSSGTTATEQFALDVAGGVYRFFTRGANNSRYEAIADVGPDGTWQHVVGVYDDTAGQILVYVNGLQVGSGTTRPAGLRTSASDVTIGSKHLGNSPEFDGTFDGILDEVAVYAKALDADTIAAHYASIYGTTTPPIITVQPVSTTNYVSLPVTFIARGAGSVPLSYQWNKNGAPIPGANGSDYTIDTLNPGHAGNYTVTISNPVNPTGITSTPVALTVLPAPTSPPAIPGLVLHLGLDNNLSDASGRGNNGTHLLISNTGTNTGGPATYVTDGALGQALHYSSFQDTTTTNNSFVSLGVRPDFQFSSNVNFTVAFWIRSPLNYAGGDLPFITTAVGSTFGTGLVLAYTYGPDTANWPGGWAASVFDAAGAGVGGRGEIGSINDGAWHHLVHVFDRKAGLTTYLDGKPAVFNKQSGTRLSDAGNIDSGQPLVIGQDPTGLYTENGEGDIDDVGIWRKALSPLEAASLFVAASANKLSFKGASTGLSLEHPAGTGTYTLSWQAGVLQQAGHVEGPYTDLGVTAPYVIPPTTTNAFYRVRP